MVLLLFYYHYIKIFNALNRIDSLGFEGIFRIRVQSVQCNVGRLNPRAVDILDTEPI